MEIKNLIWPFFLSSALSAVAGALPHILCGFYVGPQRSDKKAYLPLPLLLQFLTGVYGSYFGAGIGIMMLASLTLSGVHRIHTANALKNLLDFSINLLGASIFVLSGKVSWLHALFMMPGFALGGYAGARVSLKFRPRVVRLFVVLWGFLIGLYMLVVE